MDINADTILLGIFGNPIRQSLSPLMHNQVLRKMGYNCIYYPFKIDPPDLKNAVTAIKSLGIRGVNVTIPFKTAVIEYLDEIAAEALSCCAVNLIKNEKGRLIGYNTDGNGFLKALIEAGVKTDCRILFIGAGGAARSIAYTLAVNGAQELYFLDIKRQIAADLADFITTATAVTAQAEEMSEKNFTALSRKADIIINCSPIGMYPHNQESPVSTLEVNKDTVICDIVYNPLKTRFLAMAEEKGLKTVNGLSMFVNQGALTLEILLGRMPPVDYMQEVLRHRLRQE